MEVRQHTGASSTLNPPQPAPRSPDDGTSEFRISELEARLEELEASLPKAQESIHNNRKPKPKP